MWKQLTSRQQVDEHTDLVKGDGFETVGAGIGVFWVLLRASEGICFLFHMWNKKQY
jgi:hypothetical protein